MDDIGRAITYVFQDPQWLKKVLIGGLLVFIPIIGWLIIAGYWLRIIRQVAQGNDVPLPEWNDFGGDLVRGLKGFVVCLVWWLPAVVFSCCILVPLEIVETSISELNVESSDRVILGIIFFYLLWYFVVFLWYLVVLVLLLLQPLFLSRLAVTEQIADGLAFGAVLSEARDRFVDLLVVLLVVYSLFVVVSFGLLFCLVGIVFTGFIGWAITCHLYGQVRRRITGTQAEPFAPSPAF